MQNSGRNNVEKSAKRKIVLKWVSEKYAVIMWSGFIWLIIGFGAGYSDEVIFKFWVPREEIY
jgi:hypothetical protein